LGAKVNGKRPESADIAVQNFMKSRRDIALFLPHALFLLVPFFNNDLLLLVLGILYEANLLADGRMGPCDPSANRSRSVSEKLPQPRPPDAAKEYPEWYHGA